MQDLIIQAPSLIPEIHQGLQRDELERGRILCVCYPNYRALPFIRDLFDDVPLPLRLLLLGLVADNQESSLPSKQEAQVVYLYICSIHFGVVRDRVQDY